MTVGQHIKDARKAAGLTQEELGGKLGISGAAIAQYETGKRNPKYETLRRFGEVLSVPPESLLGDADQSRYEWLDDLYYKSVIKWSEDKLFTEAETTAIKMHLSDLLSKYKALIEATLQSKLGLLDSSENMPPEAIEELLSKDLQVKCDNLKLCIDMAPRCFAQAIGESLSHQGK